MGDAVTISVIIAAAVVVLFAVWKGRRLDAQIGSMHFELTANGGESGSLRDLVLLAAGHARLAHQRADDLLERFVEVERRVERLERIRPPAA